jgi:hypothetical protein
MMCDNDSLLSLDGFGGKSTKMSKGCKGKEKVDIYLKFPMITDSKDRLHYRYQEAIHEKNWVLSIFVHPLP